MSRLTTGPQAILYFDPYSSERSSATLISYLDHHAGIDSTFSYIVRYRPPSALNERTRRKTKLAGYGVELALKNTDYLVVDDRDSGSSPEASRLNLESVNTSMTGDSFAEVLGEDPWAELATPLTRFEILGLSLSHSSNGGTLADGLRSWSQNIGTGHVCGGPSWST